MVGKDQDIKALLKIVNGTPEGISRREIDRIRLVRLSYRHKVIYQMLQFAQQHPGILAEEQKSKLSERNHRVARQSLVQLQEMKKIAGIFNEMRIPFICIKGPQLSRMLYGREALKESVDLDILLINAEDLQRVHELYSKAGYTESNLNNYPGTFRRRWFLIAKREVHYHNPEKHVSIDLHIRPGANTYLTEKKFRIILENLQAFDLEGTSVPIPEMNAYFVYLCYHGSLHQFMRLAWLLDIRTFLQKYRDHLDPGRISYLTRTLNIERCVLLAGCLLKECFGDEFFYRHDFPSRIRSLALRCIKNWGSKPAYSLSLKGRFDKVVFILKLLKGLPAKVDWIYGIIMRQVVKIIQRV